LRNNIVASFTARSFAATDNARVVSAVRIGLA
jgi:hypothetical protein